MQALIKIVFGAAAGGLTNTVAIWMLFHPYTPPKLLGRPVRWLQGAVPKNQPRLAAAIGRTVGTRLLTPEDLTAIFSEGEFRNAFDERLGVFLDDILQKERGSIRELLPPDAAPRLEGLLDSLVDHTVLRISEYVHSERFPDVAEARTGSLVAAVADEPIGDLLTPAREAALTETVQEWLEDAVENPDLHEAIDDYLERASHRLLAPDRTFEEVLPSGLVSSFEKAIGSYLPLAIERLGNLLEDDNARAKFETTIRELFHRFLGDLKFHQRVVARFVVNDDTVDKILDTIEKEGAERLSEILQDPAVQEAMSRGVNEAVVDFLRRPVQSVLGAPESDSVIEARQTVSNWMVGLARDPQTRDFVVEKLRSALASAGARTWGDLLERIPPERVTEWMISAARSETAERVLRDLLHKAADALLDRDLGRPATWLPDSAPERIEAELGPVIWNWLQGQVPEVVEKLDIARRVEDKVNEFPMARLEEIVRKVTDRELRMIIVLGYILGAFIGLALAGLDFFVLS